MLSPAQIAETYVTVGTNKSKTPTPKLFALAIFAGMFISIAGASATIASAVADNASISRLINSMIFPAGLVMVVLAGSELFTGDCLMIIPVLKKKITVLEFIKTLIIVYLGNFVGSLFVTALFVFGHTPDLYSGALAQTLVNTAVAKVNLSFSDAFLRGILCNVLVCIAVWITIGAPTAADKILGLYPPIFVFVLGGYEHCVANMFYIPAGIFSAAEYGIAAEGLSWVSFLVNNLIPVTLGNIVGGSIVVGMGYYFIYLRQHKEK
ncbi:MAG: formate/nitrite transporter family protein [Lachnospiraceae bacterium]|nr:formate/nitrite transporter family protein [Lachnospiraceae bacterium]